MLTSVGVAARAKTRRNPRKTWSFMLKVFYAGLVLAVEMISQDATAVLNTTKMF